MQGIGVLGMFMISVLMPVYNGGKYLVPAIESILGQTYRDFELLAFDDGSADNSLELLHLYAKQDHRVSVCSGSNRGIVAVLNDLIARSSSTLLARMDADDICHPTRFEKQVAYLETHPQCVALGTRCNLIDPNGHPIGETENELDHDTIYASILATKGAIHGLCHPSVMMRKDAILRVGGYDDRFRHAEDIDLFLRLGEIGKLANLEDVLLSYRLHRGSVGGSKRETQHRLARLAAEEAYVRRGLEPPRWEFEADRPETIADTHRKWAWWALASGNVATARKHAIEAFKRDPLSLKNPRLIFCATRGR